ncbi:hypothetical protein CLV59_107345 [Chitinophaga dinghuensis]|uniref:Uncharacterized protein n=1 Tax=Chitinophaga dinghuensis TaxID=1539050 RepID=A0A327VUF9_9BACT|nr:hypothetical protein CLV59_107345 [Chitinophaga dinghuensis]
MKKNEAYRKAAHHTARCHYNFTLIDLQETNTQKIVL